MQAVRSKDITAHYLQDSVIIFLNIRKIGTHSHIQSAMVVALRLIERMERLTSMGYYHEIPISSYIHQTNRSRKCGTEGRATTTYGPLVPTANFADEDCILVPTVNWLTVRYTSLLQEHTTLTYIQSRRVRIHKSYTTSCDYVRRCK